MMVKKYLTIKTGAIETYVGVDYEQEAKLTEEQAINAMKICPTGAIMVRGVSIPEPFGERKFDLESVQK